MPRRNRTQQDKHNESRRRFKKMGKRAIFCIQHIENTHPIIVKETYKIYEYLSELYPNKRDLTKTEIYQKELKNKKPIEVEPMLSIPLIQTQRSTSSTQSQQSTSSTQTRQSTSSTQSETPVLTDEVEMKEMPIEIPVLGDEETRTLIQELQTDPDLNLFFNDEVLNQVTVTTERKPEENEPISAQKEIDRIIQQQFEVLGNDLFDLVCKDDELMC